MLELKFLSRPKNLSIRSSGHLLKIYVTCLYIAWPKTLQLRYSTRCSTQSTTSLLATALNRSFFHYRLLAISVLSGYNLLRLIPNFLANNIRYEAVTGATRARSSRDTYARTTTTVP